MSTPAPPTSTAAILSLVFGLLSWVGLPIVGAVVAVVAGYRARAAIRNAGHPLGGAGLASAGLVLGWANLALVPLFFLAASFARWN
jgi:hypothetical protein